MTPRDVFVVALAWSLGVALAIVPHVWEGPVIWVIWQEHGLGVHTSDLVGVGLAAGVTVLVVRRSHARSGG